MTPLLRSLSVALVVTLTGCASGFDRLGPFQLEIFGVGESDASLMFEYDREKQGCQVLDDDFSVEVNGAPASQAQPGNRNTPILSGTDCFLPSASFHRPDVFGQAATITATSGGDTISLELEGMGAHLGSHAVLAPGEVVHAGQIVQIAVDPGFERLRWGEIAQFVASAPPSGSGTWRNWVAIAPPSTAGVIDVQLPDGLPPGPLHIRIGGDNELVVTHCERTGASCDFLKPMTFGLSIDVVVEIAP